MSRQASVPVSEPLRSEASTREEGGHSSLLASHKYIFFLLNMLGVLLQVKFAAGNLESPFVRNYVTILMLIVDLFTYAGALAMTELPQTSNNPDLYELMSSISFLCGTLALVLLLLILVPNFGWFTLGCWIIYCLIIVAKSYSYLKKLCATSAAEAFCYVREKLKQLIMKLKGTEETQNQNVIVTNYISPA